MNNEQFENILLLSAEIAQYKRNIRPQLIAQNIGKLQKLAISLRKRYDSNWLHNFDYNGQTAKLEQKALSLVNELGLDGHIQRNLTLPWIVEFDVAGFKRGIG